MKYERGKKMNETCTIVRKIKLFPMGDKEEINRVYTYLREGIESQNRAMNQYMSALYMEMMQDMSKEDRKELNSFYQRISTSKKGSAYDETIEFAKGLPMGSSITQKVNADFKNAMKKGLQYGRISLPTYRDKNPLIIHRDYVRLLATNPHLKNGIYHNYETMDEFKEHLYKDDFEMFIKFANDITFKIIFGNLHKSRELRSVFEKIVDETYDVQGSTIGIDGKSIILNLSIKIPKKKVELLENVVVGVDLGLAIPAVCALNTNDYVRLSIGSADDFLRVRTKIQAQRKRLQKDLAKSSGGHGRKKKMAAIERFEQYESNWVSSYNHMVSRRIVDFAVKNQAKYINVECLEGFAESGNTYILRNWSYYQLQQYITYKANMVGIEVRKVNPYHTSQICSCCGHWEEGQRKDQAHFVCGSCGKELNADFNAARNIAMSTDFVE